MKFAVTSDLHGSPITDFDSKQLEGVDTLLIAGDVFEMNRKINKMVNYFNYIQEEYGVKNIIMTPGNHDHNIFEGYLENHPDDTGEARRYDYIPRIYKDEMKERCNLDILIDESMEIDGIKIYGSPWSPNFYNWAFMKSDAELDKRYEKIPDDVDILLSHTPPLIDGSDIDAIKWPGWDYHHCGSAALERAIAKKKPKYMFCGHIHSGDHNLLEFGDTKCYNVSYLGEDYEPHYPILKFKLNKEKK